MKAAIVKIGDLSAGIPRTLEEYYAKVSADNQWFYTADASAFRMAYSAQHLFKGVPFDELVRNFGLLISYEADTLRSGVPSAMRKAGGE